MKRLIHTASAIFTLAGLALAQTAVQAQELDTLVKQCGMCHGQDGNSKMASFPSFGGVSPQYFLHTMDAYKNGGRKSDLMKGYVANLSADELAQLAQYYAQQPFQPAAQEFDAQLAQQGEQLHERYCAKCHDNQGRVDPYNYGVLAGQWMPYLKLTLKEYLEGTRRVNPMMVKKLQRVQAEAGPEGFEQLVHFYSSVK